MADSFRSVESAWDIHVHADPSLFPRWGDAGELVEVCETASMEGVVLKSHHGSTVELAAHLDASSHLRVFGGVALNRFVGGLNPFAVESALAIGAKIVWLPTLHASEHEDACGQLGGFEFQTGAVDRVPDEGLTITGEDGRLLPEVEEIVDILDGSDVILASGHVSVDEFRTLQEHVRGEGRDVNLLVNHAFFHTPQMTPAQIEELAGPRTWFEITYISVSEMAEAASPEQVGEAIERVPDARWIMATDSGQRGNPTSPEALAEFGRLLAGVGVDDAQIRAMMVDEPRRVLGRN